MAKGWGGESFLAFFYSSVTYRRNSQCWDSAQCDGSVLHINTKYYVEKLLFRKAAKLPPEISAWPVLWHFWSAFTLIRLY